MACANLADKVAVQPRAIFDTAFANQAVSRGCAHDGSQRQHSPKRLGEYRREDSIPREVDSRVGGALCDSYRFGGRITSSETTATNRGPVPKVLVVPVP